MTAKEWLKDIRSQEFLLRSLEDEILVLEAKATKITQSWSDMPTAAASGGSDGLIIKLIEAKSQYGTDLDKLIDDRDKAYQIIKRMTDKRQAGLLWRYYICGKSWTQVAEEMGYSDKHVFKIHGWALQEFEKAMKEDTF